MRGQQEERKKGEEKKRRAGGEGEWDIPNLHINLPQFVRGAPIR